MTWEVYDVGGSQMLGRVVVVCVALLLSTAATGATLLESASGLGVEGQDASVLALQGHLQRAHDAPTALTMGYSRAPSSSLVSSFLDLYEVGGYEVTPDIRVALDEFSLSLNPELRAEVIPLVDALADATVLRNQAFDGNEFEEVGPMVQAAAIILAAVEAQEDALVGLSEASWPVTKVADPVGLVAIGSPGDDTYTKSRWLQLDPAGEDTYYNNAGGGKVLATVIYNVDEVTEYAVPVALSWDLAGDDVYDERVPYGAHGSGHWGVGVLVDEAGDDTYTGAREVQGTGFEGVGVFWDKGGNDSYSCSWGYCQGFAMRGVGVFQDDWGDDSYFTEGAGLGAAIFAEGYASFEDGDGSDTYDADTDEVLGYVLEEGRAFFNDTGEDQDEYIFYQNTFAGNGMCWLQNQYATGVGYGQGCDDG